MIKSYIKPPLTFKEQLKKLESRGLIVDDVFKALFQLKSISYYRLSAYSYPFRNRDAIGNVLNQFKEGTTFNEIIKLYEFDRKLRLLILDAIERIEIHIRTLLTYHLGHQYGAFGYTHSDNFHPNFNHSFWLSKIIEEAKRSKDEFVSHYKKNYEGFPILPIWMVTELMTLGSLSFCYTGLKHDDKREISSSLNIHPKKLSEWLHTLTYIRNICSHHSRLWNRKLAVKPEKKGIDKNWLPPMTPSNDRIFYILLMLKYLLQVIECDKEWLNDCFSLIEPVVQKDIYRNAMGFPSDWLVHPVWKA